ncbi:hypothetical protein HMPREF0063_11382 [Aeromicrobium marinum DSM 15272]|uniref:Uncharacterized protein n=2 Tax=Aeromicrobium marinum TaxID=219314 RepID=E2SBH3_9ACTN|nr:hypothetical protein HMPREF0063_11382 [Aeromicrobium marinum DSM 15272]
MVRERKVALAALEREAWLDRRRPARGAAALALLMLGQVLGGATISVANFDDSGEAALVGVILLVCAAAIAAGLWLGLRVWREGRRVVDALVAWEEVIDLVPVDGSFVPVEDREIQDAADDDERRSIRRRNWVRFRARTFQFSQMPRIALAVLMALPGIAIVGGFVRALAAGPPVPSEAVGALLPGLTLLVFAAVVFGGMQRFSSAVFRRWRRMRRMDREIHDERGRRRPQQGGRESP